MVEYQQKYYKVPKILTGNAFFYGRTDSGKSWKMQAIAQGYFEIGYKIFDIYGGKRKEGPFWCFPSEENKLWFEFEQTVGIMRCQGPKEYDVNLLYPFFRVKLPNKLPEYLPRIDSKIFTIPISMVETEDIAMITGDLSRQSISLWNDLKKDLGESGTIYDIEYLMNNKYKKYRELIIYKMFIKPAIDYRLLSNKNFELSMTEKKIKEEIEERQRITVLCDDYFPYDIKWFMFVSSWLMRNIRDIVLKNNKKYGKIIKILREVNRFMKIQDRSKESSEQIQIFRNFIDDLARYARSGFFVFMDTQSPAEVSNLIEGQEDLIFINEMPSQKDREVLCEPFKKDKRITSRQIIYLAGGEYGIKTCEMVEIARGKKAELIHRVQLPRNQCWKPTIGSFPIYWKKKLNKYRDINREFNLIKENYENTQIKQYIKEMEIKSDTSVEEEEKEKKSEINEIEMKAKQLEIEQLKTDIEEPLYA